MSELEHAAVASGDLEAAVGHLNVALVYDGADSCADPEGTGSA